MLWGQVAAFSPEKISKSKVIRLLKASLIEEVSAKPSAFSAGSLCWLSLLALSGHLPFNLTLTLSLTHYHLYLLL